MEGEMMNVRLYSHYIRTRFPAAWVEALTYRAIESPWTWMHGYTHIVWLYSHCINTWFPAARVEALTHRAIETSGTCTIIRLVIQVPAFTKMLTWAEKIIENILYHTVPLLCSCDLVHFTFWHGHYIFRNMTIKWNLMSGWIPQYP